VQSFGQTRLVLYVADRVRVLVCRRGGLVAQMSIYRLVASSGRPAGKGYHVRGIGRRLFGVTPKTLHLVMDPFPEPGTLAVKGIP
jgi:hypothetical protein